MKIRKFRKLVKPVAHRFVVIMNIWGVRHSIREDYYEALILDKKNLEKLEFIGYADEMTPTKVIKKEPVKVEEAAKWEAEVEPPAPPEEIITPEAKICQFCGKVLKGKKKLYCDDKCKKDFKALK